ncbi:MAG: hypothetical protein HN348_21455, partial [Proteobacteria bacterium]|nr:hypothetical protein [Pseudomonadota bacterium]
EQTLRSILLRMVAYDPDARPSAAEVSQTFRTLADRAPGPSLVSFAKEHATPWLEPVPTTASPELGEQVLIPFATVPQDAQLPPPDPSFGDDENTRPLVSWEETARGWVETGWVDTEEDEENTATEDIATLTALAFEERRQSPPPGGLTHPPEPPPFPPQEIVHHAAQPVQPQGAQPLLMAAILIATMSFLTLVLALILVLVLVVVPM